MPLRRLAIVIALVTGVSVLFGPSRAEPLGKEDCDKLMAEKSDLTTAGARDQFDRGPEWAKANMSPEQLARVKRFITVEEQLNFRCGLAKLRSTLPLTEEGGEQELDEKGNPIPPKPAGEGASAAAKGQPVPKAKAPVKSIEGAAAAKATAPAKPKPKAAPATKDAAASGTATTKTVTPAKAATTGSGPQSGTAKPQQKAKPKADDAYKPPKTDPDANPFAGQAPAAQKNQ